MWAPKIEQTEALKEELRYFHDCIVHGKTPINDGVAGWRVVRMVEAACRSLKKRGEAVLLNPTRTRIEGRASGLTKSAREAQ